MVYSCSMFFNEFRLLDLKIVEQAKYVDKIIIVEAERTHSNKPKDTCLFYNKKYNHPKLQKVLVPAEEFIDDSSFNEAHQRNSALRPVEIRDDDVIISCDLDEMLPGKDFPKVVDQIRKLEYVRFGMDLYYYKINLRLGSWRSPIGVTGKFFLNSGKTLTQLRHARKGKVIKTRGKHFSYLGSASEIAVKLDSFLHHKMGKKLTKKEISKLMRSGKDLFVRRGDRRKGSIVPVDDTYPDSILNNLEDWKEWIA